MPVICVARGGSATAARHAARIILEHATPKHNIRLACCDGHMPEPASIGGNRVARGLSNGRALIGEARRGRTGDDLLVIDASGSSDHEFAIAAALSDLILLPLHLEENHDAGFVRDAGIGDIVAGNMRRNCRQMVFLATGATLLPLAVHLEIAGTLMRRGLITLATPLCCVSSEDDLQPASEAKGLPLTHDEFGQSILNEIREASARSPGDGRIRVA